MRCPRCNADNHPQAMRCSRCGLPFRRQVPPGNNPHRVEFQQPHNENKSKPKNIPFIIALFFAVLFFVLWVSKPSSPPSSISGSSSNESNIEADVSAISARFDKNELISDSELLAIQKSQLFSLVENMKNLEIVSGDGEYQENDQFCCMKYDGIVIYSMSGREDGKNFYQYVVDLPSGYEKFETVGELMLKNLNYSGNSGEFVNEISKNATYSEGHSASGEIDSIFYYLSFPGAKKDNITLQLGRDVN